MVELPFSMCNCVQQKSEHAATIGHEGLPDEKADPGFPRSASVSLDFAKPQELVAARSWRFNSSLPHHSVHSLGKRRKLFDAGRIWSRFGHQPITMQDSA